MSAYLLRRQFLEPLILWERISFGGAGQDGSVVNSDRGSTRGGHTQNLGRDWRKRRKTRKKVKTLLSKVFVKR